MLIGYDASRAFVDEATGTENYSLNLLKALARIDRKNRYRVYVRSLKFKVQSSKLGRSVNRELSTDNFKWPSNFEFKVIRPNRFWTQLGLALETWRNPVDLLFVPAHTLPILRKRGIGKSQITNHKLQTNSSRLNSKSKIFRSFKNLNLDIIWSLVLGFWNFFAGRTMYIVTIHDLGVEFLPGYHQFPQRYYLDFASKYAARHADAVIAVSGATKADLVKRYNVAPKKVFVVHEGVDRSFFRPRPKKEIKISNLKFKINEPYILFVGTIQPRKNLEMLIEAFSRLVHSSQFTVHSKKKTVNREPSTDNCQLVLAGKLGWDFDDILAAPKKLGIESLVKFLGHVPTADLPALYSGAKVFAFPSLFEGFGLPILEALACGCPVIASDIAPHREILEKLSARGPVSSFPPASAKASAGRPASYGSAAVPLEAKRSGAGNPSSAATPRFLRLRTMNYQLKTIPVPMILVKPNDVDKWTEVLYQYISQYENRKINISKNGQIMTRFSWLDVANKTLEVFERVLR